MTGAELAAIRKAAGLSQTELAQRVGIGRHAVSYWECKAKIDLSARAVKRVAKVLALPDAPVVIPVMMPLVNKRTEEMARQDALNLAMIQAVEAQIVLFAAKLCVRCGAQTRNNTACRMKSEPGKRRCKFHGGKSTGPRTANGKVRIAQAQRARWSKWRSDVGK